MDRSQAYSVLGLASGASPQAIRAAYLGLSKQIHPDLPGGDEARFKQVSTAYALLQKVGKPPGPGGGAAPPSGGPYQGDNLATEVAVPLEVILTGGAVPVPGFHGRCSSCGGGGREPGAAPYPCPSCGGSGSATRSRGIIRVRIDCPACSGSGEITTAPCASCHGSGNGSSEEVRIEVPPGHPEGGLLRVPGLGGSGGGGGGRGDLLVQVYTAPHRRFRRRGDDLLTAVGVDFADLCLGGSVAVSPLGGGDPLTVPIAPGTAAASIVSVDGAGLPSVAGGPGKLLVRLMPRVPRQATPQQVALLRRWRELSRA